MFTSAQSSKSFDCIFDVPKSSALQPWVDSQVVLAELDKMSSLRH